MGVWRKKGDEGRSVIVGVRHEGSLWELLTDFLQAYKDRTEALKGTPPIGETSIKQDLLAIIDMLKPLGPVPGNVGFIKEEQSIIHGLIFDLTKTLPPQQKMKGTVMADYQIPDNQPDGRVTFRLSATDEENQPITDPAVLATLQFEAVSSNEDAFAITLDADQPDPMNRVGGYHVGAPGQAAVTGNLKDADGNLIGTGTDGFTVTTGKVALGSVKAEFEGLNPIT
jgi:hypothetical protein